MLELLQYIAVYYRENGKENGNWYIIMGLYRNYRIHIYIYMYAYVYIYWVYL